MRVNRSPKAFLATFLVVLTVFLLGLVFGRGLPLFQTVPLSRPAPAPEVAYDAFGLPVDTFSVVDHQIRRNETFADLLSDHNVPYPKVLRAASVARPLFDVRQMRAGKPVRIYRNDSLQAAQVMVYERDPVHYVVFDLRDSVQVYEGAREVKVVQRTLGGVIHNSLYQTLDASGVDPQLVAPLALSLSEVFAWQIDFFRIQKGDAFRVVYEDRMVDGASVGVGRILAARFTHFGDAYYGFYFKEDDTDDYFDETGASLRKAFLKAPVKYSRISSRYTRRRFHPVQKRWKAHLGTDYAADPGTPIHSTGDGVVIAAQYKRYNGNYVKIRHNGTYTTGYLHMSKIARGIRPGRHVKQGELIGYVGSTGLATGPHVCYRFWKNGKQVDPFKQDIPSAYPVPDEKMADFTKLRDRLMPQLQVPEGPVAERTSNDDATKNSRS